MRVRKLTKREVEAEPFRVWNAYVDLLARENYRDLNSVQRPAHLVFWYESEVQNGGHLQYFENQGTEHLAETIDSLGLLGASGQQQVLREAGDFFLSRLRRRRKTVKEFCDAALEDEFSTLDSRFYDCSPSLQECLQAYLAQHQSAFVVVK